MALIDRTAYPRLPTSVAERDLVEVFTPTAEEAQWAWTQVIEPQARLVLLVMLKCYRRLGYFPQLGQVPPTVTEHVHARAMELVGERIDSRGRPSERMLRRCRALVRRRTGAVWDPGRVRSVAETAMRQALQGKDNPADVINVALEALTGQGCELPAYSMLDRLAGRLRTKVNGGFHRLVAGRLDATDRARLAGLLVVDPVTRHSAWPALTRPAGRATVSRLKQHIAFLAWLDGIGDSERWLDNLPPAKISHFAGEAAVLDIDELARVGEDKRWTLLACVVHTARTRARDEVVTMFCKRMAVITSKAQDKLKELREEHRAESERLLGVFGDVLAGVRETLGPAEAGPATSTGDDGDADDAAAAGVEAEPIAVVAERTGRMLLKTLHEAGGVAGLSAAHEEVSAHHGNNYTPLMERYYRSHRAALFAMLDVLDLEPASADHAVTDAVTVLRANRKRIGEYLPGHHDGAPIDVSFASEAWRVTMRDRRRPDKLRRRHFEVCVFAHLAAELRNGNIAVAGSQEYADLHAQLMTWTECEPLVGEYCAQAGLPDTAAGCVTAWKRQLSELAERVDADYPDNADLVISDGHPVLKRRAGKDRRPAALRLESTVHQRLPQRELLAILTRTGYQTGWPRHFGPASGSDPKLRDALGRYVPTAFCYGTYLGPAELERHMPGQVTARELARAFHQHCGLDRLQSAETDVINAYNRLDITRLWGDGRTVGTDGSQVPTWENNLLAETSIRYGSTGKIAYRHISDTYVALFTRFIPCGVWEAVYILDGLLNNDSDIQPGTVHADTQGHVITWTPLVPQAPLVAGFSRFTRQAGRRSGRCRCECGGSAKMTARCGSSCSMTTANPSRWSRGSCGSWRPGTAHRTP